jgi:hypothetical protein
MLPPKMKPSKKSKGKGPCPPGMKPVASAEVVLNSSDQELNQAAIETAIRHLMDTYGDPLGKKGGKR